MEMFGLIFKQVSAVQALRLVISTLDVKYRLERDDVNEEKKVVLIIPHQVII